MNWPEIFGLLVCLAVMAVGLLGSIIPVLPSTTLVFLAALGHRLFFQERSVSWLVLALMGVLMVLSLFIDYIASMVGARKLGASWKGVLGAVLGGVVGLFFGIPGLFIGPFAGALLFELASGRNWEDSSKAGAGAFIGILAGALGKLAFSLAMIGIFLLNFLLRLIN